MGGSEEPSLAMVEPSTQSASPAEEPPLRSEYLDDPEMQEIVRLFLSEIPDRLIQMEDFLQAGNHQEFHRMVHQMKGAAGGYGFQEISNAAAALECCIKLSGDRWCRDCQAHLEVFRKLMRRAHAGLGTMP